MRRLWMLLPGILLAGRCCAQAGAVTHSVEVHIRATFNGRPLVLNDQYYVDAHGDTLFIDAFRFYITNLSFDNAAATNSHLFDAEDSATYVFMVDNAAPGNSLHFLAGVDSIANTSGANGGDLDPVKGMYWAWNSGYIMAKLEGHSSVCHTLHHAFEFHIGGYMPPYNTVRTVSLPLPATAARQSVIYLDADVAAWLRGTDLATTNSILIPGRDAALMADNYARMFSITNVPPSSQIPR